LQSAARIHGRGKLDGSEVNLIFRLEKLAGSLGNLAASETARLGKSFGRVRLAIQIERF
jgi:hypothetical protein